ncbi:hypothetical protein BDW67DRAFT_106407 [Aspergillus spinulosporus]
MPGVSASPAIIYNGVMLMSGGGVYTGKSPPSSSSAPKLQKPRIMIQPLLLAGGCSMRMGFRKELLCLAEIPVYERQLFRLHLACPGSDTIFLSSLPGCAGADPREPKRGATGSRHFVIALSSTLCPSTGGLRPP